NPTDQRQPLGMIATLQLVAGHLVFVRAVQRHQPAALAQFDRNENCATMAGGERVYGRCLHLALRWFECGNPNLPERACSPPHGIYTSTIQAGFAFSHSSTSPAFLSGGKPG